MGRILANPPPHPQPHSSDTISCSLACFTTQPLASPPSKWTSYAYAYHTSCSKALHPVIFSFFPLGIYNCSHSLNFGMLLLLVFWMNNGDKCLVTCSHSVLAFLWILIFLGRGIEASANYWKFMFLHYRRCDKFLRTVWWIFPWIID